MGAVIIADVTRRREKDEELEYRRVLVDELELWEEEGWQALTDAEGRMPLDASCGGMLLTTVIWRRVGR